MSTSLKRPVQRVGIGERKGQREKKGAAISLYCLVSPQTVRQCGTEDAEPAGNDPLYGGLGGEFT